MTQLSLLGNLAVLMGGNSPEREVSLNSGRAVCEALARNGVDFTVIDPGQDELVSLLCSEGIRHVFNILHGGSGENGELQGLLGLLGITCTGSGVLASAIAMDKLRCKQLWLGLGLPTPTYTPLFKSTDWSAAIDALGGEAIVKPSNEGSSIGMHRVASAESLKKAWEDASQYDPSVFAEAWIEGEEYTVAILGDQVLPAIQLQTDNAFYDYQAKYLSDETRYLCPCGLTAEDEAQMAMIARQAFDSLGCEGWGRVDFMRDAEGVFWLLEVNTVPGMTDHSLVPMAAKAAGISFDQLVTQILAQSLEESAHG